MHQVSWTHLAPTWCLGSWTQHKHRVSTAAALLHGGVLSHTWFHKEVCVPHTSTAKVSSLLESTHEFSYNEKRVWRNNPALWPGLCLLCCLTCNSSAQSPHMTPRKHSGRKTLNADTSSWVLGEDPGRSHQPRKRPSVRLWVAVDSGWPTGMSQSSTEKNTAGKVPFILETYGTSKSSTEFFKPDSPEWLLSTEAPCQCWSWVQHTKQRGSCKISHGSNVFSDSSTSMAVPSLTQWPSWCNTWKTCLITSLLQNTKCIYVYLTI